MAAWEPTDERELAARLAAAAREDVPVALTGGGRAGPRDAALEQPPTGAAGDRELELLSLGAPGFRGVDSLEPEEGRLTVRAGTRLADVVPELAAAGQWLPPAAGALGGFLHVEAGGRPGGSVGGLVSRAPPGPFDSAYGGVRRHLLSARTVSHRGHTLRWGRGVMKDVAGYDLRALWCGGRGRLGALVKATLRVWALPAERRLYRFRASLEDGVALALDPPAAAVRPDGLRWDWRPEAADPDGRLEVWLFGSTVSVEERAGALARWAEERGLAASEVERGLSPEALASDAAVTGRVRTPTESVLRLRAAPDRLAPLIGALRRASPEAVLGLEALPEAGIVWLGYRRGAEPELRDDGSSTGGVAPSLEAALEGASEVAVERGAAAEHAAVERRRTRAVRALEGALLEGLHGRPRQWVADYV